MTDKQKNYCFGIELLCWFTIYYSVICTLLTLTGSPFSACLWSIILVIPFAGTVIFSLRAKNAFLYILYHIFVLIGLGLILYFTNNLVGFVPWILAAGIIIPFIVFFSKRTHLSENTHYLKVIPVAVFVFFVLGIIANNTDAGHLNPLYLICACIYLLGYLLSKYINNLHAYINGNRQVANMPVSAIKKSSYGLITAFMIMSIACLFIFTNMGLGRIVSGFGTLGRYFLIWFFSLFPESETVTSTIKETTDETMAAMENPMMSMEDDGTSEVMVALSDFVMAIVQVVIVVIVAIGLIYTLYQLYQRFGHITIEKKQKKPKDKAEETFDDVIEKLTTAKIKRRSIFAERLPEDKIRRIYYKKIQGAHKKESVNTALTPQELTEKIASKNAAQTDEFTQIYEQARYGPDKNRDFDVSYYKNLAKKI